MYVLAHNSTRHSKHASTLSSKVCAIMAWGFYLAHAGTASFSLGIFVYVLTEGLLLKDLLVYVRGLFAVQLVPLPMARPVP